MGEERELKLELTEAEARRLQAACGPAERILIQRNTYLDTRDGCLRARHYGLRLRHERQGDREGYILTLKGPTRRSDAMVVRSEDEVALSATAATEILAEGLRPERAPLERLKELAEELGLAHIVSLGSMENERTVLVLRDVPVARLELDRSRYPDGSIAYELEVELPEAAEEIVAAVRRALAAWGLPWRPQTQGKFSRFLARMPQS